MQQHLIRSLSLGLAALALLACDPPSSGSGNSAGAGGVSGTGGLAPREPRPIQIAPGKWRISPPLGNGGAGGSTAMGGAPAGGAAGAAAAGQGSVAGQDSGGTGGAAGSAAVLACVPAALGTPPAVPVCGDGFLAPSEQCDDGNTVDGDGCSASCGVIPMLVAPRAALTPPQELAQRELQHGRHPLSVGCNKVGVSFIDRTEVPAALNLATFSSAGVAKGAVEFGKANVDHASPSLAGLPDDTFVAAWTDFDADELGVHLRRVDPAAPTPSPAVFANANQEFSQREPDVVFDGKQIIAAWVDDSDPLNGPDVRYRTFAPDLTPTSDDLTLAATSAVEDGVTLATFNGGWAAAWRSGRDGNETIEVQSGNTHWVVGPFLPGGADDRPALAFIDATHLAVAFTEGSDPGLTSVANVSRLHGAVLDAAYPGPVDSFAVAQTVAPWAGIPTLIQSEPTLSVFGDHLLLGWHTSLVSGDPTADELWTREVKWTVGADGALVIDTSSPDMPMIANAARRAGDQSEPAVLTSTMWPQHSVVSAWQDSGQTFGNASASTDVALQFSQVQSKCTGATLTYNHTNYYAVKGDPFVFTATSTCNGAAEYRFVLRRPDGVWIEAQPWGPSPTFNWDTTNVPIGTWNAQVWVRDQHTGDYDTYAGAGIILNDYPACTSVSLTSDYPSTYAIVGNIVHFTAAGQCAGPARYEFLVAKNGMSYSVAQSWSPSNTFNWDTTGLDIGYWNIIVIVTDAAFYDVQQTFGWTGFMLNHYAACTAASLKSDDADSYGVPGQIVHWTATSTCAGPAEYRFVFGRPDGTWIEMQPWGPSNTFTWDTTGQPVGFWNTQVWVRDAPFYDYEQAYGPSSFILNASPTCTSVATTATPNIVVQGASMTLHSSATNCTATEYKIVHRPPGGPYLTESPYSVANSDYVWNSAGAATGTHLFEVWARAPGTNQDYQTYTDVYITVNAP